MRPLTEEETKTVFLKLSEYIGKNIERMINRSDERHCFRLIKVWKLCDGGVELKSSFFFFSQRINGLSFVISGSSLLHQ